MPLTSLQREILRSLAANRDPQSFVAGAIALNRDGPRYSRDIDIFNDVEGRLEATVRKDVATLEAIGLTVELAWPRSVAIRRGLVSRGSEQTEIDWVFDSDFRYFPAIKDDEFGYVLHPVDLAINKASAAASRRVPRDIVDLLTVHEKILPLGAVLCAAVGRFPGPSPEELVEEIARNSRFTPPDFDALVMAGPLDVAAVHRAIVAMLEEARRFIRRMPSEALGVLFLADGKVVQPDPATLDSYERHAGSRRGHWPSSSEIGSAMLERYARRQET